MLISPISNLQLKNIQKNLAKGSMGAVKPYSCLASLPSHNLALLPSTQTFFLNFNGRSRDFLVNQQAQRFMEQVGSTFTDRKKCFIVVSHVISNITPFLNALNKYGRIAGFIAKPNSIESDTCKTLSNKGIDFLGITKQDLLLPDIISRKISPLVNNDEELIITDIGGYFASSLKQLNKMDNIIGIVEDTENGLQKYERTLADFQVTEYQFIQLQEVELKIL